MESDHGDFEFAFNNVTFSDRLLRIEITREVSSSTIVGPCVRDRKRKREDVKNDQSDHVVDLATNNLACDLNKNSCETNYEVNSNKKHEEEEEEGDEDENVWMMKNHLRVEEFHVSSVILAAKSPFFYKLFSNGMLESKQKHITLKIYDSEETAVMELLKFMYSNSLSPVTTVPALLNVLMAADKFEVASCMKHCISLFLKMPLTLDSALHLLELPSSVLMADSVKPLVNAARNFIASRYKDISKSPLLDEAMGLPLVGFEAILASDELEIPSEDIVYEIVSKWTKLHYPNLEERQEIFGSKLARYIRFPYMSTRKLKKILTSDDFKSFSIASKIVLEALFFKVESGSLHKPVPIRFVERAYKYKPIKIVEFEAPKQQCIVYLDLTRKECERLYLSNMLYSQGFRLGGKEFFLSVHCNMDHQDIFRCLGLFLGMNDKEGLGLGLGLDSTNLSVDYEFSARSKLKEEFERRHKGNHKFGGGDNNAVGYKNLFGIPWDYLMDKDCVYFFNDVLHIRAELSIRV